METFKEALTAATAALEESQRLALELYEQKKSGNPDLNLIEQLAQSCNKWDDCVCRAVQLSRTADTWVLARRLACQNGRALLAVPAHLQ